jgi:hypothetical protein
VVPLFQAKFGQPTDWAIARRESGSWPAATTVLLLGILDVDECGSSFARRKMLEALVKPPSLQASWPAGRLPSNRPFAALAATGFQQVA